MNAQRNALFRARKTEIAQRNSIARRLAALDEDLRKDLDAQKLRNLGSTIADTFAADHCPTCAQPITDTLLAQRVGPEVMPIEDNIEYIKAQRGIFQRLRNQTETAIADLDRQLTSATVEVNDRGRQAQCALVSRIDEARQRASAGLRPWDAVALFKLQLYVLGMILEKLSLTPKEE